MHALHPTNLLNLVPLNLSYYAIESKRLGRFIFQSAIPAISKDKTVAKLDQSPIRKERGW
jgi:hypothetical protein